LLPGPTITSGQPRAKSHDRAAALDHLPGFGYTRRKSDQRADLPCCIIGARKVATTVRPSLQRIKEWLSEWAAARNSPRKKAPLEKPKEHFAIAQRR
jgi:hypothetical protein